jgi:hypothetical protein
VECSSFEFTEILKEYGDESCYVLGRFFRSTLIRKRDSHYIGLAQDNEHTYNRFAMFGVGEAYSDWLVNKENVCIGVPRFRVVLGSSCV